MLSPSLNVTLLFYPMHLRVGWQETSTIIVTTVNCPFSHGSKSIYYRLCHATSSNSRNESGSLSPGCQVKAKYVGLQQVEKSGWETQAGASADWCLGDKLLSQWWEILEKEIWQETESHSRSSWSPSLQKFHPCPPMNSTPTSHQYAIKSNHLPVNSIKP